MKNILAVRQLRLWLIVTTGILLLCVAYFHSVINKKPLAPIVSVVSSCKELEPGVRRIGDQNGLQFDVLAKDFTIHEGTQDMPPFAHGFGLTPKNSTSVLDISSGSMSMESMATDPTRVFSDHVEQRGIFDDKGRLIGEDHWGYLKRGERWRKVRISGWVAKYGFVNEKEAELFDRVISSACLLSAPGP